MRWAAGGRTRQVTHRLSAPECLRAFVTASWTMRSSCSSTSRRSRSGRLVERQVDGGSGARSDLRKIVRQARLRDRRSGSPGCAGRRWTAAGRRRCGSARCAGGRPGRRGRRQVRTPGRRPGSRGRRSPAPRRRGSPGPADGAPRRWRAFAPRRTAGRCRAEGPARRGGSAAGRAARAERVSDVERQHAHHAWCRPAAGVPIGSRSDRRWRDVARLRAHAARPTPIGCARLARPSSTAATTGSFITSAVRPSRCWASESERAAVGADQNRAATIGDKSRRSRRAGWSRARPGRDRTRAGATRPAARRAGGGRRHTPRGPRPWGRSSAAGSTSREGRCRRR